MKLKYWLTIPLGYLFLSLSRDFSLSVFRYPIPIPLDDIIYVSLDILAVSLLASIYLRYVLRDSWKNFYVCRPAPRLKWMITATILSTTVLLCCLFLTEGTFARSDLSREKAIQLFSTTLLSFGLRGAVTEELIFRGFIFGALKKASGTRTAVIISSLAFAAMHFVNIDISNLHNTISLLAAITIIGIAFALIVLDTGSIWSGVFFHAIYNLISGDTDIIHVATQQTFPAIWTYTTVREYRWITGISGSDDIETGLPAMVCFTIVIFIALHSINRKKRSQQISQRGYKYS